MLSTNPQSKTVDRPSTTDNKDKGGSKPGIGEKKRSSRLLIQKEHEALLKEQEAWERGRQVKREARAAARAHRQEQKPQVDRNGSTTSMSDYNSIGEIPINDDLQEKYDDVCRTVAQLQASKTALMFELNHIKDNNEDMAEDLAHARAVTGKAKSQVINLTKIINGLKEDKQHLVETLEANRPSPSPQPAPEPVEPSSMQLTLEQPQPSPNISIAEHDDIKAQNTRLEDKVLTLKANIEEMEKVVERHVATIKAKEAEQQDQDVEIPLGDIAPVDELTAAHKIARLEAQVNRLQTAKQQAEHAEDEAQREMRKVARDSRRLTAKVAALELEKEAIESNYNRLRERRNKRDTMESES